MGVWDKNVGVDKGVGCVIRVWGCEIKMWKRVFKSQECGGGD